MPGMRRRRSRKAAEREGHQHLPNHSPRGSRGSDVSMEQGAHLQNPQAKGEEGMDEKGRSNMKAAMKKRAGQNP